MPNPTAPPVHAPTSKPSEEPSMLPSHTPSALPSFEPTGLADLFDPEGYAFVQRELEAALAAGIDGWMADR